MDEKLYSLRMRASRKGGHLSGAERLVPINDLESLAIDMVRRALEHPRGQAESIHLTVDVLPAEDIRMASLPDLRTFAVQDFYQGRCAAEALLVEAGVSPATAALGIKRIAAGAAPDGRSMRGAMLIDAQTGQRLEPDHFRGVRVSRMDLTAGATVTLRKELQKLGLDNPHVREALVLAAKVLLAPGVLAELCWSDDPDYTAGYVATAQNGYVRFPHLKQPGDERGGRAFFVSADGADNLSSLITFLEKEPMLFHHIGALYPAVSWPDNF